MSTKFRTLGTSSRRFSKAAGATLVLALTLTACGGSDPDSSSTSTSSGGLTKIQVMRPLNTGFEPLVIGADQGIWAKHGLDVELVLASADTSAGIPRMLNGEVQFVNGGGPQIIKAVAGGLPISLVAGVQSSTAGGEPTDGLLVPANSSIQGLADLKGKTVGVSGLGGTTNVVNNIALREAGVDPKTVKYVNLAPAALQEAAAKGQVDAVLMFGLFYKKALGSGFRSLTDGTTDLPGTLQIGYLTTKEFLAKNPETVKKFAAALTEANEYATAHPEAVRAAQSEFTQLPPEYIKTATIPQYSSKLDLNTLKLLADELVTEGTIPKAPATDEMVWPEAPSS